MFSYGWDICFCLKQPSVVACRLHHLAQQSHWPRNSAIPIETQPHAQNFSSAWKNRRSVHSEITRKNQVQMTSFIKCPVLLCSRHFSFNLVYIASITRFWISFDKQPMAVLRIFWSLSGKKNLVIFCYNANVYGAICWPVIELKLEDDWWFFRFKTFNDFW